MGGGGVVTAIASMPFTIYNDEIDQVERKADSWATGGAFWSLLRAAPAEDQYFRSQRPTQPSACHRWWIFLRF